jgi:hypothetical protein
MMAENEYRAEMCEGDGELACTNPFEPCGCEGAWSCDDIEAISVEVVAYYDTNVDGSINP